MGRFSNGSDRPVLQASKRTRVQHTHTHAYTNINLCIRTRRSVLLTHPTAVVDPVAEGDGGDDTVAAIASAADAVATSAACVVATTPEKGKKKDN